MDWIREVYLYHEDLVRQKSSAVSGGLPEMAKKLLDAPKRMGEKVKAIRLNLGFTQQQMYDLLKSKGAKIHLGYIGLYENDDRLPSHMVTLAYARSVGISTDILIDDELDLPKKLPGK